MNRDFVRSALGIVDKVLELLIRAIYLAHDVLAQGHKCMPTSVGHIADRKAVLRHIEAYDFGYESINLSGKWFLKTNDEILNHSLHAIAILRLSFE
jgi:hypothetical protein